MSSLALRGLTAALACVSILLPACSRSPNRSVAEAAVKPGHTRKSAPDFTLKDVNGKAVKLSDYKGKVVLLNFWATWCGPCKIEIPWFVEFEKQYKDQGFAVLGVAMDDEGWDVVRPYLSDKKINYRIMVGDDMTAQQYGGIDSLPTTFLLDREGRIAATHVGLVSKSDYTNEIIELLKASATSDAGQPAQSAVLSARAN